jgi:hypothetical protein
MAPQGQPPILRSGSAMFARLARQLTNRRNTAARDRPAAPLRLLVNSEVKAAKRPDRGRRILVCRWGALPGGTTLTCAWQIEILAGCDQPARPSTVGGLGVCALPARPPRLTMRR